MNINIPTYEHRLSCIRSEGDIEKQIRLAKACVTRVHNAGKNAESLETKLVLHQKRNLAQEVVRQLRLKYFEIQDDIKEKQTARSDSVCHANNTIDPEPIDS